jgi:hypothetical protein
MMGAQNDAPNRRTRGMVVLAVLATLTATDAAAQSRDRAFLGLTAGSKDARNFWEGQTNYQVFPRPNGVVKAVMLKGTVLEDADRRVKIAILGREGRAYQVGLTR